MTVANNDKQVNNTKFTLYNFAGDAKAYYLVDRKILAANQDNLRKSTVAHSIIIIDRSGSMSGDIDALKEYLLKLLTLDEYSNSQLVITLISYSSQGDFKCHFQRVTITEIINPESPYQKEIKKIHVTGSTCLSESMELAKTLIQEFIKKNELGELTAITLHSDGFAEEPNYNSEVKKLEAICRELKSLNVLINTISYSSHADFKLLSKLAHIGSGNCLQANSIKEVYDSLYKTTKLLSSSVIYSIEEPLIKDYDYQVFVSKSAPKINGSSSTLKIMGLRPDDQGIFYKYRQISQQEYEQLTDVAEKQTDESVFAFIKANLAEGKINTAKYALLSTLDDTLTQKHARALTNPEIAVFTQDIESVIFNPSLLDGHDILEEVKIKDRITLLQLIDILEKNKEHIIINVRHLQDNYRRKGVKRIPGMRDEKGNLIEPWLTTEVIDGDRYVQMGEFNINRNSATINMLITRKVKLVKKEDGEQIYEVAAILVNDLKQYNNYTVVSDGEINVPCLRVKISTQKTFDLLKQKNVLEQDGKPVNDFDFRTEYDIRLDNLPLVSFTQNYMSIDGVFDELVRLQILSSIISAHIKEESYLYSAEQLDELAKHYLSKNLYLNFPTTNEYTDLQEALNNGTVDIRISYKIDLGNTDILNLNKLYSANEFLDRLYEAYHQDTGERIDRPTFDIVLEQSIIFGHKTVSQRTKLTKVDELMSEIFDDFIGIENNGSIVDILTKVQAKGLLRLLEAKRKDEEVNREEFVSALTDAELKLNNYIERIYRQKVCPLVFYIGSTGLIPDEMEAKVITAEKISSTYPNLKISKRERDGTFFVVGNTVISVYPENEYYTTNKKIN